MQEFIGKELMNRVANLICYKIDYTKGLWQV